MTLKQEVINVISKLPEDVDFEEMMYEMYVLEKIIKGKQAIKDGKFTSNSDLKKEVETW